MLFCHSVDVPVKSFRFVVWVVMAFDQTTNAVCDGHFRHSCPVQCNCYYQFEYILYLVKDVLFMFNTWLLWYGSPVCSIVNGYLYIKFLSLSLPYDVGLWLWRVIACTFLSQNQSWHKAHTESVFSEIHKEFFLFVQPVLSEVFVVELQDSKVHKFNLLF